MQIIEIELEDDLYERILSKGIDIQAEFEVFLSEYVSSEAMAKKFNIDLGIIEEVE